MERCQGHYTNFLNKSHTIFRQWILCGQVFDTQPSHVPLICFNLFMVFPRHHFSSIPNLKSPIRKLIKTRRHAHCIQILCRQNLCHRKGYILQRHCASVWSEYTVAFWLLMILNMFPQIEQHYLKWSIQSCEFFSRYIKCYLSRWKGNGCMWYSVDSVLLKTTIFDLTCPKWQICTQYRACPYEDIALWTI